MNESLNPGHLAGKPWGTTIIVPTKIRKSWLIDEQDRKVINKGRACKVLWKNMGSGAWGMSLEKPV